MSERTGVPMIGKDKSDDQARLNTFVRKVEAYLISKDLEQALEPRPGTSQTPLNSRAESTDGEVETSTPEILAAQKEWDRQSTKAKAIIQLHVSGQWEQKVYKCKTAYEALQLIKAAAMAQDKISAHQLFSELDNLKLGKLSISTYIASAVDLNDRLKSLNESVSDQRLMNHILNGLPSEYDLTKKIIMNDPEIETLESVERKLMREEKSIAAKKKPLDMTALQAAGHGGAGRGGGPGRNGGAGRGGGNAYGGGRGGPGQGGRGRNVMSNWQQDQPCDLCGEHGHWIGPKCPQVIEAKKKREAEAQRGGNAMLAVPPMKVLSLEVPRESIVAAANKGETGYIDTGAANDVVPERSLFKSYRKLTPVEAKELSLGTAKKGVNLVPQGMGDVQLVILDPEGRQVQIKLEQALHIPDARNLLISAGKGERKGILWPVKNNSGLTSYCVGDKDMSILVPATDDNVWPVTLKSGGAMSAVPESSKMADLWHRRMGHLGSRNLNKLTDMADGLKGLSKEGITAALEDASCVGCLLNKSRQELNTMPSDLPRAEKPGQLIHFDTAYYQVETWRHNKFVSGAVDDKTKYSWVHSHALHSDVPEVLEKIILEVKRSGNTVEIVRFDGAGAHKGQEMMSMLARYNVKPQFTIPYESRQNAVAEKLWDILIMKARPMLNFSPSGKLSPKLADFAVELANQLRNRSPVVSSDTETPWEQWHKVKPNLERFKVFGSKAYVNIRKAERGKTDETAEEGILVSIPDDRKGYGVLMLKPRRVVYRIAVNFVENRPVRITQDRDLLADDDDDDGILIEEEDETETVVEPKAAEPVGATDPEPVGAPVVTPMDETSVDEEEFEEKFDTASEGSPDPAPVRRSTRVNKGVPRERLAYIVVDSTEQSVTFHEPNKIPTTWKQVQASAQKNFWEDAVVKEMINHFENGTWELVPASSMPPGVKAIPTKFVYDIKRDVNGEILKFKARLVAQGFLEVNRHHKNNYSPVVGTSTWRVMAAKVAIEGLKLKQYDFKAAFLQGDVKEDEDIYLSFPEGAGISSGMVGKARKNIYGLCGAPRAWYEKLNSVLVGASIKAVASEADMVLYKIKFPDGRKAWLLVHVDDMQIAAKSDDIIDDIFAKLKVHFEIQDLGEAKLWLGVEYRRDWNKGTIALTQEHYAKQIVQEFGLDAATNRSSVPMAAGTKLHKFEESSDEVLLDEKKAKMYQKLVGSLLYLANLTRPDLSFSVNTCARFMSAPTKNHWDAAKQIGGYLANTLNYGLVYGTETELEMYGMVDADFAGAGIGDRKRSTSGYCFIYGGAAVSWKSFLERTAVKSTCEAEIMASALGVNESMWERKLCRDLEIKLTDGCMQLYGDNQAQLKLMDDRQAEDQTKHIATRYFIGRDKVALGEIKYDYVETGRMIADIFTKPLAKLQFERFRAELGVRRL